MHETEVDPHTVDKQVFLEPQTQFGDSERQDGSDEEQSVEGGESPEEAGKRGSVSASAGPSSHR